MNPQGDYGKIVFLGSQAILILVGGRIKLYIYAGYY